MRRYARAMLTHPPDGLAIVDRAARLGLRAGVTKPDLGYPFPAVYGSMVGLSAVLKRHGGKWNARSRCMEFATWAALEAALRAALKARGAENNHS